MSLVKDLSGIIINQNSPPSDSVGMDAYPITNSWVYQEFFLPPDYERGSDDLEKSVPDLAGVQIFIQPDGFNGSYTSCDYSLQRYDFGIGWTVVTEGVGVGAPTEAQCWMNIFFKYPVKVTEEQIPYRWRLGIHGRAAITDPIRDFTVEYDGNVAIIDGVRVVVGTLVPDEAYAFTHQGVPSFLYLDSSTDQVTFSHQQGVQRWYCSIPNPLEGYGNARAYGSNGTTALQLLGNTFSFCFRLLGLVGDEGIDFLGNRYRSSVVQNKTSNLNSVSDGNTYWISRPYPSKFAVENLYFDISVNNAKTVVDQILVDPVTPGVYFNVYYSEDGDPATSEVEWENKLWTHVPQTYRMSSRETHRLPSPIGARYVKIEFSHLQARYYAAGSIQTPTRYKKYPKWVLDYFLARLIVSRLNSGSLNVVFDALDLAYNYYLDDLRGNPSQGATVFDFLQERGDASDQVDPATLSKIDLAMTPFRSHPGLRADAQSLLGQQVTSTIDSLVDYPTETVPSLALSSTDISVANREAVVLEQSYPVMFFYLTSRHRYRQVEATFEADRAYFAGVRELAFLRENYVAEYDTPVYIESNTDAVSVEQNDFLT